MHLDCGLTLVPPRLVREAVDAEVAFKLAIDADEKIEIERRGDASTVVVRSDQCPDVLAQINADDRFAVLADMLAYPAQQDGGFGCAKVADRRSWEERSSAANRNIGGNVELGGEIGDDRPRRELREPITKARRRLGEKVGRDVDRHVHPRRAERVSEDLELDPRSGAVFRAAQTPSPHRAAISVA